MIDGISSMVDGVVDEVSGLADTISSYLHFSAPDTGALSDYETWMPDFMAGLADGIEGNAGLVRSAIDGVASDMTVSPTITATQQQAAAISGATSDGNSGIISAITTALKTVSATAAGGDITVPIYIGGRKFDEAVVTAQQRVALRSGGH